MSTSILTFEKVKSWKKLSGKYMHDLRINNPLNADPDLAYANDIMRDLDGKDYTQLVKERIRAAQDSGTMGKVRKNAVLAMSVVLSFSRKDAENVNIEQWKSESIQWLDRYFNRPGALTDNVVSCVYHADENEGPHIHAIVVPIDERGRLSCSSFSDGREAMSEMQTSYANAMSKEQGIERGRFNSAAKHEDIKKWYTKLNSALYEKAPEPEPAEEIKAYAARVEEYVHEKNIAHMQDTDELNRRLVEAETSLNQLRIHASELEKREREYKRKFRKLASNIGAGHDISEDAAYEKLKKTTDNIGALTDGLARMDDRERAKEIITEINSVVREEQKERRKRKDERLEI